MYLWELIVNKTDSIKSYIRQAADILWRYIFI